MNTSKLTYKRSTYTVKFNNGRNMETYIGKCLDVFYHSKKIGSIYKCETNKDYSFAKDENTEYFCGGLTLKECKENLSNNLTGYLLTLIREGKTFINNLNN